VAAVEASRPYMSIGEVLNVLQEEFPEITVSKLRFLESEGLIHPDRTDSGYRKFSDPDVERLRYILRLQRDQFLPLKVIRERLENADATEDANGQSALTFDPEDAPVSEDEPAAAAAAEATEEEVFRPLSGVSMSREELGRACGLDADELAELETFGVITPRPSDDGDPRYDELSLEAAKLAKALLELGLEPRHLRVFRSSVDRWAALAEQMVMPLVKQRNPEARKAASATVKEFVRVGNRLMQTLLRDAISPYT